MYVVAIQINAGDSSCDESQQAANVMMQSLLNQMGMDWLSAFTKML